MAERLLDNLRQVRVPGQEKTIAGQYIEPVQLQVVCYQLWQGLEEADGGRRTKDEERLITFDDLAQAGDVDRALTQFYEETLAAALADPAAAGVSERQLRDWFDKELITEAGTRGLVHEGEQETGSLPNGVVRALQRRFLVRAEARGGDTWIELVHDRFVEPIRQSNRAWFSRNLNPLTLAAQAWLNAGKPEGKLYSGSQLAAAATQMQASPAEFGEPEQAFVEAGQQVETRRAARRQRVIAWSAAALSVMFIALAAWALWSRGQATAERADALRNAEVAATREIEARSAQATADTERGVAQENAKRAATREAEAKVARATAVAAQAETQVESERADKEARTARSAQLALQAQFTPADLSAQSLLLAVAAVSIKDYAPIAESALFEAVRRAQFRSLSFPGAASQVQFSRSGRWLVATGASNEVLVWDVDKPVNPFTLKNEDQKDNAPPWTKRALFSEDNQVLATVWNDGSAAFWKTAALDKDPYWMTSSINDVALSPDSQWLAAATTDGHIELRRVDSPAGSVWTLTDVITDVTSISISPKGSWLGATTGHNEAYLWKVHEDSSGQLVVGDRVTLAGHTQPVTTMEFSHDDRWLATSAAPSDGSVGVNSDPTVRLWGLDIDPGSASPSATEIPDMYASSLAFSNDGSQLAIGIAGQVRVWNTETLQERLLLKCGSKISKIAFSKNGEWLAASDDLGDTPEETDFDLCLWRLSDPSSRLCFPATLTTLTTLTSAMMEHSSQARAMMARSAYGILGSARLCQGQVARSPVRRIGRLSARMAGG